MTLRLVFRPEAEAELVEARGWYEEQSVGLGDTFATTVSATIARIVENPLAHQHVHGDIRRALVSRFPYAVYFYVLQEELVVLAVMHGHRHPRRWQVRR